MDHKIRPCWGHGIAERSVNLNVASVSSAGYKILIAFGIHSVFRKGSPLSSRASMAKHPGSEALTSFPLPIHLFYFQLKELTLLLSLCSDNL